MLRASLTALLESWHPPRVGDATARRALWFSFADGVCSVAVIALLDTHGMAALLSLRASDFMVAMLPTLALFLASLVQLATPYVSAHLNARKPLSCACVVGQVICLVLLGLAGWTRPAAAPLVFVLIYALYSMSGNFGSAVWISWIGDLVPEQVRGRMFAWRSRCFSIAQVSVGVLSGIIVKQFLGPDKSWVVFMSVFMVAAFFRLVAFFCLVRQHEPPLTFKPASHDFTYLDFILKARTSNFSRFTIFIALIHGGTAIAGPFFAKYYLTVLKIPYDTFALIVNAYLIGMLVFLPFWGRISDRYGNWLVVKITAVAIALFPLPYLFFTSPVVLWFLGFFAGVAWSGFSLANFSYQLDTVTPPRRVRCAAYMSVTVGFAVFACGLLGGWLVDQLPPLLWWNSNYQTLFALSSIVRMTVIAFFLGFSLVHEIRSVKPVTIKGLITELPGIRLVLDIFRGAAKIS